MVYHITILKMTSDIFISDNDSECYHLSMTPDNASIQQLSIRSWKFLKTKAFD